MISTVQYETDAPTMGPVSKFKRFQTEESTASTDIPEYEDLSDFDDSDDDLGVETEAMMKASDGDFEAEIEAEILEATTRKLAPVLPIEEAINSEAFAPLPEVCTESFTESDFWATEVFIFALGLCILTLFVSTDIQGKLTKFIFEFCVSLMVLCMLGRCGFESYIAAAAISIPACLIIAPRPHALAI